MKPRAADAWAAQIDDARATLLSPPPTPWHLGANVQVKPRVSMPCARSMKRHRDFCDHVA